MQTPLVQLTTSGTAVSLPRDGLTRLRAQFEQQHFVRLPGFLAPAVLQRAQRHLDAAPFKDLVHEQIGLELGVSSGPALNLLFFLSNDPALFTFVQEITLCDRVGCFMGRIYRMVPASGHYDSWHDDVMEHRMIGLSVNLSPQVYRGGVLQLRDKASRAILCEATNTTPGDAILFRIATFLEHRLTAVEGTIPKTAFAGWFRSHPDFLSLLAHE